MKNLSKLLLAVTFAISVSSSAFAVVVASWGGAYTDCLLYTSDAADE